MVAKIKPAMLPANMVGAKSPATPPLLLDADTAQHLQRSMHIAAIISNLSPDNISIKGEPLARDSGCSLITSVMIG